MPLHGEILFSIYKYKCFLCDLVLNAVYEQERIHFAFFQQFLHLFI